MELHIFTLLLKYHVSRKRPFALTSVFVVVHIYVHMFTTQTLTHIDTLLMKCLTWYSTLQSNQQSRGRRYFI